MDIFEQAMLMTRAPIDVVDCAMKTLASSGDNSPSLLDVVGLIRDMESDTLCPLLEGEPLPEDFS